ncbi:MAG: polymer-forming cytoskeletal protein [Halioglobus sp.]|nr:polymer-forming cytoskeletal protein [Halioglobus sp.]
MLGSKRSGRGSGKTTLIAEGTVVDGDIQFSGSLEIEGLVRGNIVAEPDQDALVRVVGKGCVEGEIRAPNIVLNGEVRGDVHATRQLELAPRGRVSGNVFYAMVEMSAGAEVNGSLTHVSDLFEECGPADKPGGKSS